MSWAWLAIGLGALIIVTRAPLIVRPSQTLELYRGLWATDARARALALLYLALAVACFLAAREASEPARSVLYLLTCVLVAVTAWGCAMPGHFRGVIDRIVLFVEHALDTAAIRALAVFAVCLGGLLIWLGVRAL